MPWDLCTNPAAAAAPVSPSFQPPTLPSMSLPLSGKMASALPSLPLHGAHPPRLAGAGLPRRSQTAAILLMGWERSLHPPSPQCPFCNSALHVTLNGSGLGAAETPDCGRGWAGGLRGGAEGSRAGEEGRPQLGLVPGAIRSPGGADGGGGAGAPTQAAVGPNAGGRMSDSELHPLRQERQNSLLSCSLPPPPPHLRLPPHDRRYSQHTHSLSISTRGGNFPRKVREKPGRSAGSHTPRGAYLRGGEEGGEKGEGAGALTRSGRCGGFD